MPLDHPNARLLVFDRLVKDQVCCVQAFVRTCQDLGVLPPHALTEAKLPIETVKCGSLYAARLVLEHCLKRHGAYTAQKHADIWNTIEQRVEDYKQRKSLIHVRNAGERLPPAECARMAPAVVDVLLQELIPFF